MADPSTQSPRRTAQHDVLHLTLVVWLFAAFGNAECQTTNADGPRNGASGTIVSCTKDAQCPSGQRCGFMWGCESKGQCVVPSEDTHCIDPGGGCGCHGRPVVSFCAAGSRTEFTSALVNALEPCPGPCTAESGCGSSGLVCEKGFCVERRGYMHQAEAPCLKRKPAAMKQTHDWRAPAREHAISAGHV